MTNNVIRLVQLYSNKYTKGKIIISGINKGNHKDVVLAVLVIVKKDFGLLDTEDRVLKDTESYQIRPKTLFKTTRGIYFKDGSERRYLAEQEIIKLIIQNNELGKFLQK